MSDIKHAPTIMEVTDEEFLTAIFGADTPFCHVTDFVYPPDNIPKDKHMIAWKGDYYSRYHFQPNTNRYFTISTFYADDTGQARRRKALYRQTHCLVLDDVREKLSEEAAARLPRPSWILETSKDSFQYGFIFNTPVTEASKIDNLNDGLIDSELAPKGKDPGQKGTTRYVKLPSSINNKAAKLNADGTAFKSILHLWEPQNKVDIEQLAAPFAIDLNKLRRDARVDGAADISDHPLLHTNAIHIKEIRSAGRFDCTCPWVDEHTGKDDTGSAIFTNADGSIGFKCHHGSCDSRTGADLLKIIETKDSGFNERFKSWQMVREFENVVDIPSATQSGSPLMTLLSSCANGESEKMKKQMLEDKFILKDLAILGQWTVFYAGPNIGKTLLTFWLLIEAIKDGVIKGEDVFYANCDDTYKGGVEKLEIAEANGFNMMIPNVNEFKAETLLSTMQAMAEKNEAKGKIIVLDTLKKFTDLMDKKLSSDFGKIARAFISAGGSMICLAHVNKHKGLDGKSINAGTSDVRDDADCCYTIEYLDKSDGFCNTTTTVEFECNKSRGVVSQSVAFQYTKEKGAGYLNLLNSVKRVTKDVVEQVQKVVMENEQQQKDADVIEHIKVAITNEQYSSGDIVKFVVDTFKVSRVKVREVLARYQGQLWLVEKGLNNKLTYSLNVASVISDVSFL